MNLLSHLLPGRSHVRLETWNLDPVRSTITLTLRASPCCMDRRYGRIEPYPCSGSCGADILGASEVQHSVQHVGGARDIGLDQSPPVVARGFLPSHAAVLGNGLEVPVAPRRCGLRGCAVGAVLPDNCR